jgi:pimeloyl-ACP methyl ester carboxylesterase
MRKFLMFAACLLSSALMLLPLIGQQSSLPSADKKQNTKKGPTIYRASAEEKQQIQTRLSELDAAIRQIKAKRGEDDLMADVEVYSKAGHWLLDYPDDIAVRGDIQNLLTVLDQGIKRATALQTGQPPWTLSPGRRMHGMYSALDGSVQPYEVIVPESYDPAKPARLYVWLHGRGQRMTESNFLFGMQSPDPASTAYPANDGQIQVNVFGRSNTGYHWAAETDIFEVIAAVQRRYKIDPDRILLRGFSLGGAGAWKLALHYPDRWAAAEIGAGTWPRRYLTMNTLPVYQQPTLRIDENMTEWALNAFNLPLAAHDGDSDPQVPSIPVPPPGTPNRGQLESSLRIRAQLEKEGFPSVGEPDFLKTRGLPAMFMISQHTGHGTSPLVRERLNAFLKTWGERGRTSPDHIRFLTYTTRYNRDYWVTLTALEKHYERSEVDAERLSGGANYKITTKNISRLDLRETSHAVKIHIDGQELPVKGASQITLEKTGGSWKVASGSWPGLHKTHALQGPIEDAFIEPFLAVRPTGKPWNEAANKRALENLNTFQHAYARRFRALIRVKDDKDVTAEDFAKYNVALFGDPGSNRWIAKVAPKLPVKWTKQSVSVGRQNYSSASHIPVLVYPNPLSPAHYVVLNSGYTFEEREYTGDYAMPRYGDFAVLRLDQEPGSEVAQAGFFDESWKLAAK